jgi:formylglycine-generating enzyme required for sulfatase activity
MSVPVTAGMRYFDLYHGVELKPEIKGQLASLSFDMEGSGYGAILATPGQPSASIVQLMDRMARLTRTPLGDLSHQPAVLHQSLVEIPPTQPASDAPAGMVKIPGGVFDFKVQGIEIEGGASGMVDVQYPWEPTPRRFHSHSIDIKPLFIDKYPVTNAQFKQFVDAAHYAPRDTLNFLRDWKDGRFPAGWENRPVTWVSLEDARAYAKWAGKRLPHEWEWQLAAQGADGRNFPWGNYWVGANVPAADFGRSMRGPDPVDAHPAGVSSYGVMDLVGNVWQWTDEYSDEHTRFAIVRGGEYYQPAGSIWYFPQAYRNDQHGKLLLMAPSYDRSGGIGFRCVKDAE